MIGADQVLAIGNEILQKPGSREEAREQLLKSCAGRRISFIPRRSLLYKGHAADLLRHRDHDGARFLG